MNRAIELDRRFYSRSFRLKTEHEAAVVAFWRDILNVQQAVTTERISHREVTNESGLPGCSLVGVVYDEAEATIYHTRALTAEDIVHELLHVAHPDWTEAKVVAETERRLAEIARRAKKRLKSSGLSYASS